MTRMKELTEEDKKTFRRLRSAFRRALFIVMQRRGSRAEMQQAILRVAAHATDIGWLERPKPAPLNISIGHDTFSNDPKRTERVAPVVKVEVP